MAVANVVELKRFMKSESTDDEWLYADALDAAGVYLRTRTGREFVEVTDATTATARSYRPEEDGEVIGIHDAASITSVVENGVTLVAGTDYVAEPANNLSGDGSWRPTTHLIRHAQPWYRDGAKLTVVVTAKWGWSTMPVDIKLPYLVCAKAYIQERDVSLGIAAITEQGATGAREAKSVAAFINDYRRLSAWGS